MKKILVGNWKMNLVSLEAESFFASMPINREITIGIAAPATLLRGLRDHADRLGILLGAQNMHENKAGPYTGEISAAHLLDAGADFVILGHSERRVLFHETNDQVEKKVESAVVEGLSFVLCVGETREQDEEGVGDEVVTHQIRSALSSLTEPNLKGAMVAYEPVWAIGAGQPATADQIEEKHQLIRDELIKLFGEEGKNVPILYGGSVNADNLEEILQIPNVDGALVGGASLDPQTFNEMIEITGESS